MMDLLSPSALANEQDGIIALGPGTFAARSPDFAAGYTRALIRFSTLLRLGAFSGTLPPNNLQIRQDLLLGALSHRQGNMGLAQGHLHHASDLFRRLCYHASGRPQQYSEGYSYFRYVRAAFDFYAGLAHPLPPDLDLDLSAVQAGYEAIAAPDGSVPVTDTRITDLALPVSTIGWTRLAGVSVLRTPRAYLLVCHQAQIALHRRNRHVAPDFGHFVLWRGDVAAGRGFWDIRHPWYEGYAAKQARPGHERDYLNVPRGAFNRDSWRWAPSPNLEVMEVSRAAIRLRYNRTVERHFLFRENGFTVHDPGRGAQDFPL